MSFKFRDYQKQMIRDITPFVVENKIAYISAEVRTGKTLISLGVCHFLKVKNVLFVTTKKTLESNTIINDYNLTKFNFDLDVINHDSVHKINKKYDVIIVDEAHLVGGAFPKPSNRYKKTKAIINNNTYVILLSGTPSPETKSQLYHQFALSYHSPFKKYSSFYKWSHDYINIKKRFVGTGQQVNDYTETKDDLINKVLDKYFFSVTQKVAGFNTSVNEQIHYVEMSPTTEILINRLKKDLVIEGEEEVVLADTGAKMQSKIHQLSSGTVKFESGNSMILDLSKAEYIANKFYKKKIAIFYKFKEELNALKNVYKDSITDDLQEFYNSDKSIALQIRSGARGISLKEASDLVYYNIDFSAELYWQSRDRLTTKERDVNNIHWIFSKKGIEKYIYKRVQDKKDFTLSYFKQVYE